MASDEFVPDATAAPAPATTKSKKYDTNNRGAKVIDQFGKTEYRRRQIDLGLSQEVLPPVTRKGVAKYRVLPNPNNPEADLQPIFLPGSFIFYDKHEPDFSKRNKEIKNTNGKVERVKYKDGTERLEEEVNMLEFHNGVIVVNMEAEYMKYVCLELHPNNKSNKFRDTSIPPAFERIDFEQNRSVAFKIAEEELAEDAVAELRAMTAIDDIRGLAVSAGIPTIENNAMRDLSLVKSDLRQYAWKNPRKFFSLSKDTKTAVKMTLLEADSVGVIEYQHDSKKWIVVTSDEPMHVVLAGEDPVTSLVAFIHDKDGRGPLFYTAIQNLLNRWNM